MDKDKSHHSSGSLLPPLGRYSVYSSQNSTHNTKPELLASSNLHLLGPGMPADSNQFSHDISRMPDNPPKSLGHRRAHSEILTLPDDISFDSDLGVVGGVDGPSFSDENEEDLLSMYLDMDTLNSSSGTSAFQVGESSRKLMVEQVSFSGSADNVPPGLNEKPRIRHQHSQSMDGSTSIKSEMLMPGSDDQSSAETKKAMSAAKLAELALIDPKRAKRVWANRQSAARSKERKMRYIGELERKLQTLQTEATTIPAQLALLQRDTNGLTSENGELKLCLQAMEQQVHLQDALNDALKEEIQHLKVLTGQTIPNGGSAMNFPAASYGANQQQQYYSNNHTVHTLLTAQLQQLQFHTQQQEQQAGDLQLRTSLTSYFPKDLAPDSS